MERALHRAIPCATCYNGLINKTFLALAVCMLARNRAYATVPPTEAWRREIPTVSYPLPTPGPMAIDRAGNLYITRVELIPNSYGRNRVHLLKLGPDNNGVFDVPLQLNPYGTYVTWAGVIVSEPVGGKQYVYVAQESFAAQDVVYKVDTNGVCQWANPFPYVLNDEDVNGSLLNMYAGPAGDLKIAFQNGGPLLAPELDMVTLGSSGDVTAHQSIKGFFPTKAIFDPALNEWIATTGAPDIYSENPYSAWGAFDPNTGATGMMERVESTLDRNNGTFTGHSLDVQLLPNNAIAVIDNVAEREAGYPDSEILHFRMKMLHPNGCLSWMYPAVGAAPGNAYETDSFGPAAPIYVIANSSSLPDPPRNLFQLDQVGNLNWCRTRAPAATLLPNSAGFYSVFDRYYAEGFVEHANSDGVFDWGRSYRVPLYNWYVPLKIMGFRNSFYVLASVLDENNKYRLLVDRFITGVAFQAMSLASTVQSHQHLKVTLNLNAPAPRGGLQVKLLSNNSKLLMPNHTLSQTFTVPEGESALEVKLKAQPVSADTSVTLIATSDGIRRAAAVSVTR